MPNWLVFTIIAGIASTGFSTLLRRNLRANADSTAYAWWFEVIRAIFFACLIPFFPEFRNSLSNILTLSALGFTEFIAVYLFMKMHSLTELSLSTIILQLRSVWVPIIAFFLIGEILTLTEWLGIAFVVTGAVIVARPKSLKLDRGVKQAFLMTIASSLSGVILKESTGYNSIPVIMFAFSFPSIFLLPLFMKNALNRIRNRWGTVLRTNLPASAFNILSMFALASAAQRGTASQVAAVFQGVTMISVIVGVIYLHETDAKIEKFIAGILTTIGILLLV